MEGCREAGPVAKDPDFLVESLSEKLDHVFKVTIPCDQHKLLKLIAECDLHCLHYYCHVHLLLDLHLESFLAEWALLVGAPCLLLFEAPYVHTDRVLLKTVV